MSTTIHLKPCKKFSLYKMKPKMMTVCIKDERKSESLQKEFVEEKSPKFTEKNKIIDPYDIHNDEIIPWRDNIEDEYGYIDNLGNF